VNTSALALYAGSWIARRRGRNRSGVALSWAGATFATAGGFLGGHLLAGMGVGVDHNAFEERVDDWTAACDEEALSERPIRVDVHGSAVLLVRRARTGTPASRSPVEDTTLPESSAVSAATTPRDDPPNATPARTPTRTAATA